MPVKMPRLISKKAAVYFMPKNQSANYFVAAGLLLLILILGCAARLPEKGTLQGHITIGPLCPVETNPPDPNCQPTEETYNAYHLLFMRLVQVIRALF